VLGLAIAATLVVLFGDFGDVIIAASFELDLVLETFGEFPIVLLLLFFNGDIVVVLLLLAGVERSSITSCTEEAFLGIVIVVDKGSACC